MCLGIARARSIAGLTIECGEGGKVGIFVAHPLARSALHALRGVNNGSVEALIVDAKRYGSHAACCAACATTGARA